MMVQSQHHVTHDASHRPPVNFTSILATMKNLGKKFGQYHKIS